jgi:hypothetical protein
VLLPCFRHQFLFGASHFESAFFALLLFPILTSLRSCQVLQVHAVSPPSDLLTPDNAATKCTNRECHDVRQWDTRKAPCRIQLACRTASFPMPFGLSPKRSDRLLYGADPSGSFLTMGNAWGYLVLYERGQVPNSPSLRPILPGVSYR